MDTANPGADRMAHDTQNGGAIPADTFAARLVLARHFAGRLSIEQAARRSGLNAGNWAHWEDGRRPRDRVDVAQAIAEALGIDFHWLLLGGPLAGPRGVPTPKRPHADNGRYQRLPVRPKDARPNGRSAAVPRPAPPARSEPRRPVRINQAQVA